MEMFQLCNLEQCAIFSMVSMYPLPLQCQMQLSVRPVHYLEGAIVVMLTSCVSKKSFILCCNFCIKWVMTSWTYGIITTYIIQ